MPNFAHLKDVDNMDSFIISVVVVDQVKESEQIKRGCYVTIVITYKNPLMVNKQPVTLYFYLGEREACNTIFS